MSPTTSSVAQKTFLRSKYIILVNLSFIGYTKIFSNHNFVKRKKGLSINLILKPFFIIH
ncbi:hypothetical protein UT300009_11570 [Paraclostridium bifermentans]